jgi:dethiobiotin synthetase
LLAGIQGSDLPANLYHFDEPISPWSAARRAGVTIHEEAVVKWIREQSATCDLLLVEGAGGLLTPLGEQLDASVLIKRLDADVIVVTRNRLGVLNQSLLAIAVLRSRGATNVKLALIEDAAPDYSTETNYEDLCALNKDLAIARIPWLEGDLSDPRFMTACSARFSRQLQNLVGKKNPPDTDPRGLFP